MVRKIFGDFRKSRRECVFFFLGGNSSNISWAARNSVYRGTSCLILEKELWKIFKRSLGFCARKLMRLFGDKVIERAHPLSCCELLV